MAEFPGTQQQTKYIWQARKPLAVPGGRGIQQGETFTPTEEMIVAYRDLMVPVGESLRTTEKEPEPEKEPTAAARSGARTSHRAE